jgi:hypothetical protein
VEAEHPDRAGQRVGGCLAFAGDDRVLAALVQERDRPPEHVHAAGDVLAVAHPQPPEHLGLRAAGRELRRGHGRAVA